MPDVLATAIIGLDGPDPTRRAAWRDRHVASITAMARDGLLLLGLPLHSAEGRSRGSLMIVAAADDPAVERYLAAEPFAVGGVWHEIVRRPLRIPALPWRPWPADGAPTPPGRGHSIMIAAGAVEPTRLGDVAEAGDLIFAAETLDEPGAILVTTHRADAAARDWIADDPMLRGCRVDVHATLFRPLPYRPLPGPG